MFTKQVVQITSAKFVKQLLTQVAPALAMTLNLLSQQKIPDDCCKSCNSYLKTR